MKILPIRRPPGFFENLRSQPLLFVGSALGLLAVAALKGGWGARRPGGGGGGK